MQVSIQMEEMQGQVCGKAPRASMPCSVMPVFYHLMFINPEALGTLYSGDFMEVPSCQHVDHWLHFQPFSWDKGGQGWKFWASNHGLVFLMTSPPSRSYSGAHQSRSWEQRTLLSPKVSGVLCQEHFLFETRTYLLATSPFPSRVRYWYSPGFHPSSSNLGILFVLSKTLSTPMPEEIPLC